MEPNLTEVLNVHKMLSKQAEEEEPVIEKEKKEEKEEVTKNVPHSHSRSTFIRRNRKRVSQGVMNTRVSDRARMEENSRMLLVELGVIPKGGYNDL